MTELMQMAPDDHRHILMIDEQSDVAQEIVAQLALFGYTVTVHDSADRIETIVAAMHPMALLIDMQAAELVTHYAAELPPASGQLPPPIIMLAAHTDLNTRLAALRLGSKAFLPKPINIEALVQTLDYLTGWRIAVPYRVLIVDDAPMAAIYTANILKRAGMEVAIVHAPMDALAAIDAYLPDLVLMDLYMPDCTGRELAAIIRQQPTYVSLPIVFLSGESDRTTQLAAISEGGDDFLMKPIESAHLIASLTSRIERARSMRAFLVRDGLTGLLNHSAIMAQLDTVLVRTQRNNGHCAVAVLDLDHFKHVNDTYGHLVGDRVLRSFARLLQQYLRRSDGIGRYGGEEFIVVFPDTDSMGAYQALEGLRVRWSHVQHQVIETSFTATLSAGIAEYPQDGVQSTVLGRADQALYTAKRAGRNQIAFAHNLNP